MFDDMDSKALFSSEVFRNLLLIEKQNEVKAQEEAKTLEKTALDQFNDFQNKIKSNPNLKQQFKTLQKRFLEDEKFCQASNKDFVHGVLLLDLDD